MGCNDIYLIINDDIDWTLIDDEVGRGLIFLLKHVFSGVLTVEHFLHNVFEFFISESIEDVVISQTIQNEFWVLLWFLLVNLFDIFYDGFINIIITSNFLYTTLFNYSFLLCLLRLIIQYLRCVLLIGLLIVIVIIMYCLLLVSFFHYVILGNFIT